MEGRIGIIGGTSLVKRASKLDLQLLQVETPYGHPSSPLHVGEWGERPVALLVRHGLDHDIPPHRLNHRANIEAMRSAGVRQLILIASAGSLQDGLKPPSVVLLDDYASPFTSVTFHDDTIVHITPALSDRIRGVLAEVASEEGIPVVNGGTYVQTLGPRLETRAEVRALRTWGDVVGMTVASEASLALERGMEVAGISSVDNMAHGLGEVTLDFQEIMANATANWQVIERLLKRAVPRL